MSARVFVAATLLALVIVTTATAGSFTTGPLVHVRREPVCRLHRGRRRGAGRRRQHELSAQRGRAVHRRQPGEPGEPRLGLPAVPLVRRRRTRERRECEHERRHELDAGRHSRRQRLLGRRVPACSPMVGELLAERRRPSELTLVQRSTGAVHRIRLLRRDPREPVAERRPDVERACRRASRHGAEHLQRQGDDHRGIRRTRTWSTRSGIGWSFRRGKRPSIVASFRAAAFKGPTWFSRARPTAARAGSPRAKSTTTGTIAQTDRQSDRGPAQW